LKHSPALLFFIFIFTFIISFPPRVYFYRSVEEWIVAGGAGSADGKCSNPIPPDAIKETPFEKPRPHFVPSFKMPLLGDTS
jgi:hypothetical protein